MGIPGILYGIPILNSYQRWVLQHGSILDLDDVHPDSAKCINLEKSIGKNDFPYHFNKIIVRYKKIGHKIYVLRQTACLVVSPIKVHNFAYLFDCTTVGRASD